MRERGRGVPGLSRACKKHQPVGIYSQTIERAAVGKRAVQFVAQAAYRQDRAMEPWAIGSSVLLVEPLAPVWARW